MNAVVVFVLLVGESKATVEMYEDVTTRRGVLGRTRSNLGGGATVPLRVQALRHTIYDRNRGNRGSKSSIQGSLLITMDLDNGVEGTAVFG